MSIFKPNGLSPNMEEVIVSRIDEYENPTIENNLEYQFINGNGKEYMEDRGAMAFTFVVHAKMSFVRSYKLSIYNNNATEDNLEDYLLADFYGSFEEPYKGGDEGVIYIEYNDFLRKGIIIKPGDEYIWKIRLYEDPIGYTFYEKYDHFFIKNSPMVIDSSYNEEAVEDILSGKEQILINMTRKVKQPLKENNETVLDAKGDIVYKINEDLSFIYETDENEGDNIKKAVDTITAEEGKEKYGFVNENFNFKISQYIEDIIDVQEVLKNVKSVRINVSEEDEEFNPQKDKVYTDSYGTYRLDYSKLSRIPSKYIKYDQISGETPYLEFSNQFNIKPDNLGSSQAIHGSISMFTGPKEVMLIPFYDNSVDKIIDMSTGLGTGSAIQNDISHTRHNLVLNSYNKFYVVGKRESDLSGAQYNPETQKYFPEIPQMPESKQEDESDEEFEQRKQQIQMEIDLAKEEINTLMENDRLFISILYLAGYKSIIDDTYVGSGFISGSTKGVMWIDQKKYPVYVDDYFGYDSFSDFAYDPNDSGDPSLSNMNNSDFTPFGIYQLEDGNKIDLQINKENTSQIPQQNFVRKSIQCTGWNLPVILCDYLNKYKNVKLNDIIPGLNISWKELELVNDDVNYKKMIPILASTLAIFYNSEVCEKIYLNKDQIPDFNKWKKYFSNGNMWVRLKINSNAYINHDIIDNGSNVFINWLKNIYQNYDFKIITSGVDKNGFYIGIDPSQGLLYCFLEMTKILFGVKQITYQYSIDLDSGENNLQIYYIIKDAFLKIFFGIDNENIIISEDENGDIVFEDQDGNIITSEYETQNYQHPFDTCIFIYKQREKITQIDEGLGKNNLTRLILENPMHINKFLYGDKNNPEYSYRSQCCTNLLSDNFTKNSFYIHKDQKLIDPGNSYIHVYRNNDDKISDSYIYSPFEEGYPKKEGKLYWNFDSQYELETKYCDIGNIQNNLWEFKENLLMAPIAILMQKEDIAYNNLEGTFYLVSNGVLRYNLSFNVNEKYKKILKEANNNQIYFDFLIARPKELTSGSFSANQFVEFIRINSKQIDTNGFITYDDTAGTITFNWEFIYNKYHGTSQEEYSDQRAFVDNGIDVNTLIKYYYIYVTWGVKELGVISEDNLLKWAPFNYGIQKIANYDSNTGLVQLEGSLPRVPDISYKYQVFNIEKSLLETTYKDTENLEYIKYYYLSDEGVLGEPKIKNSELLQTNFSPWEFYSCGLPYKNIQGATEELLNNCKIFIQPSVIKQDKYKNARLNVYNKFDQVDLYAGTDTFNGKNVVSDKNFEYYKDFIIDKLTEDQWLVNCRYDAGDWTKMIRNKTLEYISLDPNDYLIKPQGNYKIYSNFSESIPGGYFYVRSNKIINIKVVDMFGCGYYQELNDEDITNIEFNSLKFIANINDEDSINSGIENISKIKSYKYKILDSDYDVIYESEEKYDNDYVMTIDWIKNSQLNDYYIIDFYAEDEFGYVFNKTNKIFINGLSGEFNIDDEIPRVEVDCKKQRVSISKGIESIDRSSDDIIFVYKIKQEENIGVKLFEGEYDDYYYITNDINIYDYNIGSNIKFKYIIIRKFYDENGNYKIRAYISNDIVMKFNNWSLLDLIYDFDNGKYMVYENKGYYLKNNFEEGMISNQIGSIFKETEGVYPKIEYTNKNFDSGSFDCLLGDIKEIKKIQHYNFGDKSFDDINVSIQYIENKIDLENWIDFIQNGNPKLFRNPKGNVWIVSISGESIYDTDYKSSQYPTIINFEWYEIMNSNIPLIGIF